LFICHVHAQEWTFDAKTQQAYDLVLNLQITEAQALIPKPESPQEEYVASFAEAIELLVTEDIEKFSEYEARFIKRRERRIKLSSEEELFMQAEIALQWTFIYLKYGHEFDAATNLRQSYQTTQEVKKRFPKFRAINKTSGLLDVIIGSVPEKYDWILALLNMEGNVDAGMQELEGVQSSDHVLAFEASLLKALTLGFVLQKTDEAIVEIKKDIAEHPTNKLALFMGATLYIKNSQSEEALTLLGKMNDQPAGLPVYYADYLRGEIYLHKAEYLNAISAYRNFISHYQGQNYIKDANYKIGLCYLLNGNTSDAQAIFKQARSVGKESAEADRYAARSMADTELPHVKLTKVRYATDGGYYKDASKALADISPKELPTLRDQVEYYYRKARIAHKTGDLVTAQESYLKVIQLNGNEPWYFAPNSYLQLGYLAVAANKKEQAREYFSKALTYKKHEYKNSIDSKAKSALAQLKR
jgi:TolA-binding protein